MKKGTFEAFKEGTLLIQSTLLTLLIQDIQDKNIANFDNHTKICFSF